MTKSLKLELLVNGKKQTFTENFIPAGRILDALDLLETDGADKTTRDVFTERVNFLAKVFTDPAVTAEAIWDGLNALNFDELTFDLICQVAGVDPKKLLTPITPE